MASAAPPLPETIAERLATYKSVVAPMLGADGARFAGIPPLPPLGEFVDRPELEWLEEQLNTPQLRALVVVGPGGVGKTALAQRFIATLERRRHETGGGLEVEGIVYLSARTGGISLERLYMLCAELMGGDVEASLTAYWNNAGISPAAKAEKLVAKLQDGSYLIVFDDLPSDPGDPTRLPDDIALFLAELDRAPHGESVKVLATSREALLESLHLPRLRIGSGLEPPQALELLRTRGVTAESDAALRPLIAAVEGAPRALELIAAALLQGVPAEDLLVPLAGAAMPLEARLAELALRNYRAFAPGERRVLAALAVFERPVPAVGVDLVLHLLFGGEPDSDALLERLVSLRAVHRETMRAAADETALFSLHDIDAAAILAELAPADRADHERAASRFYHEMRRPQPWHHIRAADMHLIEAQHLARTGDWAAVLTVLDEVDFSLRNHHKYLAYVEALGYGSFIVEQRAQLDRGLARSGLKAEQARNLTSAAWVCRRLNRKPAARARFRRALVAAAASEDNEALYYALAEYGYFVTDNSNAHQLALRMLRAALRFAEAARSDYARAHCTLGLAFAHFQLQQNAECEDHANRALEMFAAVGDGLSQYRAVDCLTRLSMLYRKQSRDDEALRVTERALAIARDEALDGWLGELESQLGFHKRGTGHYDEAIEHHRRSLHHFTEPLPLRRQQAVQHSYMANLLIDTGELEAAETAFENARRIATIIEVSREQSWIAANRAILLCRLGDYAEARAFQHEALGITERNDHRDSLSLRCTDGAEIEIAAGDAEGALRALARGLGRPGAELHELVEIYVAAPEVEDALPHEMQAPGEQKRRGAALARLLLIAGDAEAANRLLARALGFRAGGVRRDPDLHLLAGIGALRTRDIERASGHFASASHLATRALARSGRFYPAAFTRALAGFGAAAAERREPDDARRRWDHAVSLCSAAGVVQEARSLLGLLGGGALR